MLSVHALVHSHTRAHTHKHTHRDTHTHTHTHTHTQTEHSCERLAFTKAQMHRPLCQQHEIANISYPVNLTKGKAFDIKPYSNPTNSRYYLICRNAYLLTYIIIF